MHFSDVICCPTILLCVFLPQRFEERIQLDSYLDFDEWRLPTNHHTWSSIRQCRKEIIELLQNHPQVTWAVRKTLLICCIRGILRPSYIGINNKPVQIIIRIPMNQLGYRNVIRVFEHCSLRHGKFEGLVFCPSEHAHTLRCFIRSHPNGTVDKPWNPCVFPWNGCQLPWNEGFCRATFGVHIWSGKRWKQLSTGGAHKKGR